MACHGGRAGAEDGVGLILVDEGRGKVWKACALGRVVVAQMRPRSRRQVRIILDRWRCGCRMCSLLFWGGGAAEALGAVSCAAAFRRSRVGKCLCFVCVGVVRSERGGHWLCVLGLDALFLGTTFQDGVWGGFCRAGSDTSHTLSKPHHTYTQSHT